MQARASRAPFILFIINIIYTYNYQEKRYELFPTPNISLYT